MWFEELPEDCPPNDAVAPKNAYFRLVEQLPPTCGDFWSHRKVQPDGVWDVPECRCRSVSVFDALDKAENVQRMTAHKHKRIVKITLTPVCGVLQQTGKKGHYSWWRSQQFSMQTALIQVIS